MQKARSHPTHTRRCRPRLLPLVSARFQGLFHSPPGVLFTFPSRYSFAIGRSQSLALEGGPPRFSQGFSGPDLLGYCSHCLALGSPTGLSPRAVGRSRPLRLPRTTAAGYAPLQPLNPMAQAPWFGLLPVRSPLLGESHLISLPPGTEMFQFPGSALPKGVTGHDTRRVSPFGHRRITGCLLLPYAFRSLPRPSSPGCA